MPANLDHFPHGVVLVGISVGSPPLPLQSGAAPCCSANPVWRHRSFAHLASLRPSVSATWSQFVSGLTVVVVEPVYMQLLDMKDERDVPDASDHPTDHPTDAEGQNEPSKDAPSGRNSVIAITDYSRIIDEPVVEPMRAIINKINEDSPPSTAKMASEAPNAADDAVPSTAEDAVPNTAVQSFHIEADTIND
ncbi:hypothetical protein B0T17DRAFT_621187 [Bombardia bombarda]|uniref:Uncharacterized protein n=1 Tax=Bombardia bombarda TaxID=252184 RepID=A0AA39TVX7_9PEZI|nr:hypothetical protein B0T17DRAFT_621187 [Bombardia bombarda]